MIEIKLVTSLLHSSRTLRRTSGSFGVAPLVAPLPPFLSLVPFVAALVVSAAVTTIETGLLDTSTAWNTCC